MNPRSRPETPSSAANPAGCRVAHSSIRWHATTGSAVSSPRPFPVSASKAAAAGMCWRSKGTTHASTAASQRRPAGSYQVRRVLRHGSKGGRPAGLGHGGPGPRPRSGKAASSRIACRSPAPRLAPGAGAGVEGEGLVDPLFRGAGGACEGAGELVFAVLDGAGLVEPAGPLAGGAQVAQAQDRGGLAVPGQERGDVAVLPAVADEGLAEAGQPAVTWVMIRRVTAFRVCGSGACGTLSMMAGANAGRPCPPAIMKRAAADAPGRNAAGPGVADDAAGRVLPAVHRAVVPHVHHAGLRFPRAAGEADGVRHAGRGGPVAAVAA